MQPNRPLNFDLLSSLVYPSSTFFLAPLHGPPPDVYLFAIFRRAKKKKKTSFASFTHLRARLSGCSEPPLLRSFPVMLAAHFEPLCPRSPLLPASATVRSFCGCRGNRGGWSPAGVGKASGCVIAGVGGGCVACPLTCRGLGGGANSAEEPLLAQSASCLPAAPP